MSTVSWLDPASVEFPTPDQALEDPNGLLAVGGDLSPERLIAAYRLGIFPWFEESQPILWWSPSPRAVLFPANIYLSKSLKKRLRRQQYSVSCDQQFSQVMQHCANIPRQGQDGTWITDDMLEAYCQLFEQGIAHSIEVWFEGELIGGLYGIAIGKIFYGESMFSLRTDASKVAFAHLAKQLDNWHFALIDCQVSNPHLTRLGAEEIDRGLFSQLLSDNIDNTDHHNWSADWNSLFAI
ncbi:leucyl/phenylalanyl-tRNA--protein transferase [Oceanicoccus sagamiensis]|uniref:Leucyl/phenylalanyl-tRNA--protein transferase n=1 Tax=Oceanicoccus sagamiensis TaxID=716816 RepID=A0A1X9NPH0_9GAMM|nr:leucyl/phenylalanyl-tRNA--protein transferase [Oceanicoccus sagamiensis]ARN75783.1 leucyl/phenylalanyl-tRNA--protein transferase [Oceanicoccus sagamiensis]